MNKLEEYKIYYGKKYETKYEEVAHNQGFDAAVALDLPVKYAKWKDSIFKGFYSSKHQPKQWIKIQRLFDKIGKPYTEQQLYQYWLDNILKLEE